jgi:hypothetical protein
MMMVSISEFLQKIKNFFTETDGREKILTTAVILLVGTASFGLGRLSVLENRKEPVKIENLPMEANVTATIAENKTENSEGEKSESEVVLNEGGMVVGSKSGSKYHFPWCPGAKRILEENKVYFSSTAEAKAKGYTPAANCKGLE